MIHFVTPFRRTVSSRYSIHLEEIPIPQNLSAREGRGKQLRGVYMKSTGLWIPISMRIYGACWNVKILLRTTRAQG